MFGLGVPEMLVIGVIAVLLFGKRLPEVARSMGKSVVEFKKGMHGLDEDVRGSGSSTKSVPRYSDIDDRDEATAPKFEPPPSEPKDDSATVA